MSRGKKYRSFTLIEILVVITVIALIGGAVGINVVRGISQERYFTSVKKVVDRIQFAQEVMLIARVDIGITFKKTANGVICKGEVIGYVPPPMRKQLEEEWILPQVDRVSLIYRDGTEEEQQPELQFISSGHHMTEGVLQLSGKSEERFITLPGYPRRLDVTPTYTHKEWNSDEESTALFPYEVMNEENR